MKLIWRLKEQPSTESLRELVKDKILTNEEAREILFSSETEEDRDKKGLESEIKFLRELVDKLSSNKLSRVVEVIKEVYRPYEKYDWYRPYTVWCDNQNKMFATNISTDTIVFGSAGNGSGTVTTDTIETNKAFSSIKTF
mgnify:CR=1 FL=1